MATKAPTPPPGRRRATASGSEPPRLLIAALVIMGLAMLLVAIAGAFSSGHAETFQVGNLILEVDGDYAPHRLPANELAPIELEGEGHGRTDDGSLVPVTKEVIADFDKNGTLTTRGIDQCNPRSLQNTTTRQALKKCKSSLVGKGQVSGVVDFPDQKPFAARGPLLIFNGTKKGGDPSVIFHVLADVPLPTTFIVQAAITKSPLPGMGKRVVAKVPPIAGYNGRMTDVVFHIFKKPATGPRYLLARCGNGRFRARVQVTTLAEDLHSVGEKLTVEIVRPCQVAG